MNTKLLGSITSRELPSEDPSLTVSSIETERKARFHLPTERELNKALLQSRENIESLEKRLQDLHKAVQRNRKDKITVDQIRQKIIRIEQQLQALRGKGQEFEKKLKLEADQKKFSRF